ncbi:MAG: aminodeoxychorismate synthase, component I, partial [Bosea sp.]|uniref:chorismate-binding protein n=1 Tax=Bosea sp. (in: a-proteobacteria) TaxID=1871050 RepID=UPI00239DA4EC|nr:aminodeoxychorismate synthase, component I [Bosea sp. (in: a-proteobacteria)]
PPGALPIAWWGLFAPPREVAWTAPASTAEAAPLAWRPLISQRRYRMAIRRIRERIAAGDTYQVNYTFPLETPFQGDPIRLFAALCGAQRSRFCAYVDLGRFAVCSASPELFFELDGERITTRPMKGTARRGRWGDEDLQRSAALAASAKDRAENLMIVDMMRNDLGKIARPGSVRVEDLFAVETYPTLHQLTSTV